MSTNCMIALKLRPEDRGRTLSQEKELLCGIPVGSFTEFLDREQKKRRIDPETRGPEAFIIGKDTKYLCIRNQFDGYIDGGAGQVLLEMFDTYEKVRDLVLGGDTTAIDYDHVTPKGRFGDEKTPPRECSNESLPKDWMDEYSYLFRDGEWWVKTGTAARRWHKLKNMTGKDRYTER